MTSLHASIWCFLFSMLTIQGAEILACPHVLANEEDNSILCFILLNEIQAVSTTRSKNGSFFKLVNVKNCTVDIQSHQWGSSECTKKKYSAQDGHGLAALWTLTLLLFIPIWLVDMHYQLHLLSKCTHAWICTSYRVPMVLNVWDSYACATRFRSLLYQWRVTSFSGCKLSRLTRTAWGLCQ